MNTIQFDYHVHSSFCDGKGEPEEYIKKAIEKNVKILGFSSHAPVPFKTDWTMKPEKLAQYIDTVQSLKANYRGKFEILLGLEVDYIPGVMSCKSSIIKNAGLDYTISSVHVLGKMKEGFNWTVDGPFDETNSGINYSFKGNAKEAVTAYYMRIMEMAETAPPDIIGHFDLIKMNNKNNCFFSESDEWYRLLVDKTLKVISHSDCALEVNTGGITRNKVDALYPSTWILKKCFKLNIPIAVTSDSHRPEQITGNFNRAVAEIKNAGYKRLVYFTDKGRAVFNLD